MAQVLFKRKTTAEIKNLAIVDGQLIYDTETGKTYMDVGNKRISTGGDSSFSGSYNDLTDKPTIPTVNNATLTIQKNGTTVKTFTANASSNVTANITVPTKTSELTNDSAFVTQEDLTRQISTAITAALEASY